MEKGYKPEIFYNIYWFFSSLLSKKKDKSKYNYTD